jgi:glucose-1-phosphate adenylyltransferase
MLSEKKNLIAYEFKGYWKDVGTIDSLWEANMDLLDPKNPLNLNDSSWLIYTEDISTLPQYIGKEAKVKKAYITQGVRVEGNVTNSVLFTGAVVAKGAKVTDSVLMPGAVIEEGATVTRALVAENVRIGKKARVGSKNSENIELVAKNIKGGAK